MADECFIKLIIPCYNVEHIVGRMLDSILGQTFTDYHIVCVDDCSTDNTFAVLKDYGKRYPDRFTILRNETNVGAAESRNRGYDLTAKTEPSEYVWFVDADDVLAGNDVLYQIYDDAYDNPDLNLIYIGWTNERGKYAIANVDFPIGLWGMVIRQGWYEKGIPVQPGDDYISHYMTIDSVPDDKIGSLDYNCYIYPQASGGTTRNGTTVEVAGHKIADYLTNHLFKKQSTIDSILHVTGKWLVLQVVPNLPLKLQNDDGQIVTIS